jgi:hypothetical protein
MRRLLPLILLLAIPATVCTAEWQNLFNGKDLSGWKANFDPEAFAIVDGAIRIQAASGQKAHLFYVGDGADKFKKFKNFELVATVRAEPNSNGGIFVHCDHELRDSARHLAKGYEVQLNSAAKEARKTGSLYAVVDLDKSPVVETDWFQVYIRVEGQRIEVKLNDQQVIDYTEPKNVERPAQRAGRKFSADGGAIALQAHDNNSVWYFKEIRIKRLP